MALPWGDLPSVVLTTLYKKLSIEDRLQVSSVCRNWRNSAFQLPLRDDLHLNIVREGDIPKATFLINNFVRKVSEVVIVFDPFSSKILDLVGEALYLLQDNRGLKTLKLSPTSNAAIAKISNPIANLSTEVINRRKKYFTKKVVEPLKLVLGARNQLLTLSIHLLQNFSDSGNQILPTLLTLKKNHSIRNLSFPSIEGISASAKFYSYDFQGLENIQDFKYLQTLSIEHDALTDPILCKIGLASALGGLRRVNLIATRENASVSNHGWSIFVENNPKAKVRITVAGGTSLISPSAKLILPAIPLSHFRMYYCKGLRMNFLNSVVRWNEGSLEHLELVDEDKDWMDYLVQADNNDNQFIDPIVYASWRCRLLHTIKIGFVYCGHSLIGIAKLKGPSLRHLEIPKSQVVYHSLRELNKEISRALNRPWRSINDTKKKRRFLPEIEKPKQAMLCSILALQSDEDTN